MAASDGDGVVLLSSGIGFTEDVGVAEGGEEVLFEVVLLSGIGVAELIPLAVPVAKGNASGDELAGSEGDWAGRGTLLSCFSISVFALMLACLA